MRLKDKVVLVTASTRGIGLAIVKKCAEEGARVYMAARDMERAQEIANTLNGVKCLYNDAIKPETFTTMVEDVVRDAGRIDVLVNNFGTSNPGKDLDFANTDPQIFLDTVNPNLRSVFMASQAAARHMAQHGGSIINISSSRDRMSQPQSESYTAAKGGISALTHALAVSFAGTVRVNSISPGYIGTDLTLNSPTLIPLIEKWNELAPMHRLGKPEELQAIAVYLAGDASPFTTGSDFVIDGAFTCF